MATRDDPNTSRETHDPLQLHQAGTLPYVQGTGDTKPWSCTLFDPAFGIFSPEDLDDFCGANCSVVDGARPATIAKIVLHIRQLIKLVRHLLGSDSFQLVNGTAPVHRPGRQPDELWHMLTSPDPPAHMQDDIYQVPLWGLANQVKHVDEVKGIEFHCPLTDCRDFGPLAAADDAVRRPYRSHHNLVMHLNECMEILDHEYAATGGILSLLPAEHEPRTDGDDDDDDAGNVGVDELQQQQLEGARNTIFGQWLLFTQHLVARMHELELNYANALDLLSGEAVVPMQMLARLGPDARSRGRDVVHGQDKFIVAGVDDDIVGRIHRLLDKAEARSDDDEQQFWESGVSGERMWKKDRSGQWYARGLVSVDLTTRFFRLKDHGSHSAIFILPAIHHHAASAHTRELEKRPTVVSVVAPRWTERVSDLEDRLRRPLKQAKEMEDASSALQRQVIELQEKLGLVSAELRRSQAQVRYYESVDEEGSREEVLAALKAHQEKFASLKSVLPREYHAELKI